MVPAAPRVLAGERMLRYAAILSISRSAYLLPLVGGLALASFPAASAPARHASTEKRVVLLKPVAVVPASRAMANKIAELSLIDADGPLDPDLVSQTLSLFGREDLIAAASDEYRTTHCAPLAGAPDVLAEIVSRARRTSIVIVNESHTRSEYRGFSARLAQRLRPLGYDTLALETLAPTMPDTPTIYLPAYRTHPDLPYFEDSDGHYLSEAGFGRLGRTAKALGYHLLAYEPIPTPPSADMPQKQRTALREEAQANTLARYLHDHPKAKMLIHVDYSHAAEVPTADGERWMAARLKTITGIDPLTISQTTCRGGGNTIWLATLPPKQPPGTFDLVVDHPDARFVTRRPAWRIRSGDRAVRIPRELYPKAGWRVIEARPVGEADASVPLDRVAIRRGETVALMLPPGRYALRAIDVPQAPREPASTQ